MQNPTDSWSSATSPAKRMTTEVADEGIPHAWRCKADSLSRRKVRDVLSGVREIRPLRLSFAFCARVRHMVARVFVG